MSINVLLFFIFATLSITSSIFVIISKNPIFSVLFLVLTFANVSSLLFLFDLEFLPASFIVIYVGAIGVLFLFVLMMLNIKLAELKDSYSNTLPFSALLGVFFICELMCLLRFEINIIDIFNESSMIFLSDFTNVTVTNHYFLHLYTAFSNVKTISYALFSNYIYCFLLSGVVLLLAMIASIVLTLQKNFVSKTQDIYNQTLKDYNTALVNYM
jgi:NADH-quinone oxidoreductase subunit J